MSRGFSVVLIAMLVAAGCQPAVDVPGGGPVDDWPVYGHDAGGSRHSPLTQITRGNVRHLQPAWTYRTGDVSDGTRTARKTSFQATPIVVDGTLYLSTPFSRVVALDPETGGEKWTYDPKLDLRVPYGNDLVSRGVSAWLDTRASGDRACRRTIFLATNDARLVALDASTGAAMPGGPTSRMVSPVIRMSAASARCARTSSTRPPRTIVVVLIGLTQASAATVPTSASGTR